MENNYTTPMSYTEKLVWLCTLAANCLKDNNNRFPSAQVVLVDSAKELQRLAKVEKEHEALLKSIEEENDTYSFDWLDFYGGKIRRQTL